MEHFLQNLASGASWPALAVSLVVAIVVLGKSADSLVDVAVSLSLRWGIPSLIVGATIVSLGTTLPEVVVSVVAAIQGKPGLAVGNAVGSIICDTGLIMGIACIMAPIPLDRKLVNRQGWVQFFSAVLLVIVCFPFSSPQDALSIGSFMSQNAGFAFIGLLVMYIFVTIKWSGSTPNHVDPINEIDKMSQRSEAISSGKSSGKSTSDNNGKARNKGGSRQILIILLCMVGLAISSQTLVSSATEIALRMSIPQSIIAATVVAFGTSLPELVTAISSVRKGHGELAVGNVIGADILNVLLVAGAAASVTPTGLTVGSQFFTRYFPAMLGVLIVFRVGITMSKDKLDRRFGILLLSIYLAAMITSYA